MDVGCERKGGFGKTPKRFRKFLEEHIEVKNVAWIKNLNAS